MRTQLGDDRLLAQLGAEVLAYRELVQMALSQLADARRETHRQEQRVRRLQTVLRARGIPVDSILTLPDARVD